MDFVCNQNHFLITSYFEPEGYILEEALNLRASFFFFLLKGKSVPGLISAL